MTAWTPSTTNPRPAFAASSALLSPHALMNGAIVAVFSSTIPLLLDQFALKRLPSQVFGVLMSASPAVSAGAGTVILRENLTLAQWLGIFAIMLACTGCMLKARPREN
ncbi:MAG: threonine/homoserine exporter RhtA [Caulobacteraceae bacterium]|nr:threonine/homoserine exporter RhtA [Caulobacteraceae bacterium]